MADKRRARRESDPGLQPERTSLAWFRTLLGYGALMALAIKHSWHRAGLPFWLSIGVLAIVAVILWGYPRRRHLMDVDDSDFLQPRAVRDKFFDRTRSTFSGIPVCCYSPSTDRFIH